MIIILISINLCSANKFNPVICLLILYDPLKDNKTLKISQNEKSEYIFLPYFDFSNPNIHFYNDNNR